MFILTIRLILFIDHGDSLVSYLINLCLPFSIAIFLLWIWFHTKYIIEDAHIIIKFGPMKKIIKMNEIEKIRYAKNPFTAPALALDRIEITYARFNTIAISPKNKSEFIQQLLQHNPKIKVER